MLLQGATQVILWRLSLTSKTVVVLYLTPTPGRLAQTLFEDRRQSRVRDPIYPTLPWLGVVLVLDFPCTERPAWQSRCRNVRITSNLIYNIRGPVRRYSSPVINRVLRSACV